MEIERENDVEQLRRIARMQQIQIEQLLKVISQQSHRIDALEGKDGELQRALDLSPKGCRIQSPPSASRDGAE